MFISGQKANSFAKKKSGLLPGGILTMVSSALFATLAGASYAATETNVAKTVHVQALNIISNQGNALVTAQFDREQLSLSKQRLPLYQTISTETGDITLRDDGEKGDEKAYDGIYSAITEFDFDGLIEQYARLESFQSKDGEKALPLRFDSNRQLIGTEKFPTVTSIKEAISKGLAVPLLPIGLAMAIDEEKSLLVRHPGVVQDPTRTFHVCTGGNPNGVWTFKHLMTEMANTPVTGITPEAFTRMWLSHWESPQSINGWVVPDRNAAIHALVIDPWEAASGGPGSPLNLDLAPFQLLAIVNRVDLRDNLSYGGGSAGEGRFVFQVMNGCNPTQFTVIFEYGIEKKGCFGVKDWGQRWADLDSMVLGSPAYNAALEIITESFVKANASPSKPNGSALNQLRTNEIALQFPWQLREFVISDSGWNKHLLAQNTVAQTPANPINGTLALRNYVMSPLTEVPLRFPTIADPFRGGSSEAPSPLFHWDEAGIFPRQDRHEFSLNTCNGCHAGETSTFFTHIKPGPIPAGLSGFMTGINVADPADGLPVRHFDDLARRATDLDALINSSCLAQLTVPKALFPH